MKTDQDCELAANIHTSAPAVTPLLVLPKRLPITAQLVWLRSEGVHVQQLTFDPLDRAAQAAFVRAGLARLTTARARRLYWMACHVALWRDGTWEWSIADLHVLLDSEGELPVWADFEHGALQEPLADLHRHADFRLDYHLKRRGRTVVAARFALRDVDAISK